MIRGYVSSDEDDYDDYDFGYSEPLIITDEKSPSLPEIQTEEVKEKLYSALEESKKIEKFLKAVELGDITTLKDLIVLGVSPDCRDPHNWTPLMKACGSGNFDVVQVLLEHGADPNKHRELFTPLMTCCTQTLVSEDSKLRCVRLLLENGAEVNAKDKYRVTALMYASGSGYADIVTKLLEAPGIEVNVQDKEGWTALFHAVYLNDINLVKKLVSAGSDIKLKDKYDRTVINLALDKDFIEVAEALGYTKEESIIPEQTLQLKERFLKELPDSEGQGGFTAEALNILHAFKQFNVKSINLPDLLNATAKDLFDIGVKLQPERHKLLTKGIHRYHLQPWKSSSRHQINQGVPMSLEDAVAIAGTLASHLTIANASLRYLDTRISLRQNKEPVDLAVEKETIIFLINTYNSAKKLSLLLPKVIKLIEKIKPETQADYIYPYRKGKYKEKFFKFFWCAVGAATAGLFICNCKSNFSPKTLVKFIFHPAIAFFPLFQSDLNEECPIFID